MWQIPKLPAAFVSFTEEILNRKLHFLCSESAYGFVEISDQQNIWLSTAA